MVTKSRLFCIAILTVLILVAKNAHAFCLPDFSFDIPPQTVSIGGTWSYDIGFTRASGYNVTLRIQMTGFDPGPVVRDLWKTSTQNIWTTHDRFNVPIVVNLQFVEKHANQVVDVTQGPGSGTQFIWYSGWPAGSGNPVPWAHEVGHMFRNFDEYPGGFVNPDGSFRNVPDGLMGSGRTMFDRYYQFVADWAATQAEAVPTWCQNTLAYHHPE
jgi:hypothetical protein